MVPEGGGQRASHPVALPSAASEVENVITLQESQDALEVDVEKRTLMKKMMVWEPRAGLECWVGRRWTSRSTH